MLEVRVNLYAVQHFLSHLLHISATNKNVICKPLKFWNSIIENQFALYIWHYDFGQMVKGTMEYSEQQVDQILLTIRNYSVV